MNGFILFLTILFVFSAHALDEEADRLPAFGQNVSATHPDRAALSRLALDFVKATEGKDKAKFSATVTPEFTEQTGWLKDWGRLSPIVRPELIAIHDVLIMDYKKSTYMRFTVFDLKRQVAIPLPENTWYQVVSDKGIWRMNAYLEDFAGE